MLKRIILFATTLFFSGAGVAAAQAPGEPVITVNNPLGFTNLGQIFSNVLSIIFFLAGLLFFVMLLMGGLQWISAGGDSKALDSARSRITNAFIGLIIVAAAYALAAIVQQVFGINIVSGFNFN
jgi:hypothetical protein